jgi:hypothetical protein
MVFSPMNVRASRSIFKSEVLLPPVNQPVNQSFQSGFAIRHASLLIADDLRSTHPRQ